VEILGRDSASAGYNVTCIADTSSSSIDILTVKYKFTISIIISSHINIPTVYNIPDGRY